MDDFLNTIHLQPVTTAEMLHTLSYAVKALEESGKLTLHHQLRLQVSTQRITDLVSTLVDRHFIED